MKLNRFVNIGVNVDENVGTYLYIFLIPYVSLSKVGEGARTYRHNRSLRCLYVRE